MESPDEVIYCLFPPNAKYTSCEDMPASSSAIEALAEMRKDNPNSFHPEAKFLCPLPSNSNPQKSSTKKSLFDLDSPYFYTKPPRLGLRPQYIQQGQVSMKRYIRFVSKGDYDPNCVPEYTHEIVFDDNGFTVDGESRDINDPRYLPFLESLNKIECPDEFNQPGHHTITVIGRLSFDKEFLDRQAKIRESSNSCKDYPVNYKGLTCLTGLKRSF